MVGVSTPPPPPPPRYTRLYQRYTVHRTVVFQSVFLDLISLCFGRRCTSILVGVVRCVFPRRLSTERLRVILQTFPPFLKKATKQITRLSFTTTFPLIFPSGFGQRPEWVTICEDFIAPLDSGSSPALFHPLIFFFFFHSVPASHRGLHYQLHFFFPCINSTDPRFSTFSTILFSQRSFFLVGAYCSNKKLSAQKIYYILYAQSIFFCFSPHFFKNP